ncbi:PREDICTED: uncharacterized protein LOC109462571 [Branchiostoma belcheri]|uniref:Uncharacterized protein LOC109462571 n=1 Tax=Branchiostoma belcheri TaxID=7741 RepID=A0A6P4XRH5_BRABE|nr:PREDICTED: uncharacterized protein LOC109462571 [Branchiostoma belcheri]
MAVLLAGVGNLRNVMATVAGLKKSFNGSIRFAQNDSDPQIMARNVFFLSFLWKYRQDGEVARKLTQIWYSVKIAEEEAVMAQECLRELLLLTEDSGTLCGGRLTMAADQVPQIRTVFELWLSLLSGERRLQTTPQEQLRRIYQRNADATAVFGTCNPFSVLPLYENATKDLQNEPDWTNHRNREEIVFKSGATAIIEYFDNWDAFTQYLRAALLAHRCPESSHPVLTRKDVPKMSEVSNNSGMKMRNFLRELNTVLPFRYRINVRRVNLRSGHKRALEWTLADSSGQGTTDV